MKQGIPLNDEDRKPWLEAIKKDIDAAVKNQTLVILSCSALKRRYRDFLRGDDKDKILFVYLKVTDPDTVRERMKIRQQQTGHYMPASLLDSQLAALEEPLKDEAVTFDNSNSISQIVDKIFTTFFLKGFRIFFDFFFRCLFWDFSSFCGFVF